MNFQICRPAVTDPHKVRPCNYRIVSLPYPNTSWSIQIYTLNTFGELAATCTPLRMVNIDPHSLYYSCIYHQVWQTSVATVCMPMSSQLQGRWVRVCRVRTKDMELLTLSVLYLQGSDAGQKYFKIYWIFKFAVPLWLTRVRSDLVATQDCSPILYEYLLKYSDLHLEDLWRTSCYMYPPPPPPLRMVNIDPHSLYFSCIYPSNLTDYCD